MSVSDDPTKVNFVCEVPRGTRLKWEVQTKREYNPLVPDTTREGTPRYYALDSLVNYGCVPQTYEDPAIVDRLTGLRGDGDPLDVCEVGVDSNKVPVGAAYQVHVVGALGLIDGGETDWKILAVKAGDPLAAYAADFRKAPASFLRLMDDVREWFRNYKVPEGKGQNDFAFGGAWQDRDTALQVIHETHEQWKNLVAARRKVDTATPHFGEEGARTVQSPGPWVWQQGSKRKADWNSLEHAIATMPVSESLRPKFRRLAR